jgi:hypothetical protein
MITYLKAITLITKITDYTKSDGFEVETADGENFTILGDEFVSSLRRRNDMPTHEQFPQYPSCHEIRISLEKCQKEKRAIEIWIIKAPGIDLYFPFPSVFGNFTIASDSIPFFARMVLESDQIKFDGKREFLFFLIKYLQDPTFKENCLRDSTSIFFKDGRFHGFGSSDCNRTVLGIDESFPGGLIVSFRVFDEKNYSFLELRAQYQANIP